jgi:hypothetical protein
LVLSGILAESLLPGVEWLLDREPGRPDGRGREPGGIDSPTGVDDIAVTAAWFAVLAPFACRPGRRRWASAVTPRLARVINRDRWRAALAGSRFLAKLGGGLLARAGVIDPGRVSPLTT